MSSVHVDLPFVASNEACHKIRRARPRGLAVRCSHRVAPDGMLMMTGRLRAVSAPVVRYVRGNVASALSVSWAVHAAPRVKRRAGRRRLNARQKDGLDAVRAVISSHGTSCHWPLSSLTTTRARSSARRGRPGLEVVDAVRADELLGAAIASRNAARYSGVPGSALAPTRARRIREDQPGVERSRPRTHRSSARCDLLVRGAEVQRHLRSGCRRQLLRDDHRPGRRQHALAGAPLTRMKSGLINAVLCRTCRP